MLPAPREMLKGVNGHLQEKTIVRRWSKMSSSIPSSASRSRSGLVRSTLDEMEFKNSNGLELVPDGLLISYQGLVAMETPYSDSGSKMVELQDTCYLMSFHTEEKRMISSENTS